MNQTLFVTPQQQPEGVIQQTKTILSGALQSRNIRIHRKRTSIRLEPEMWQALNEIATLETCSIHDLCGGRCMI